MAAPPIPPKGSSDTWMKDTRVNDPLSWNPDNLTFSQSSQARSCFSDNFSSVLSGSIQTNAPPLPPRRPFENNQRVQSTEINELTLVPPPTKGGPLFKNTTDLQGFSRNFSSLNLNKPPFLGHNSFYQGSVASASGLSTVPSINSFNTISHISTPSLSAAVPSGTRQPFGFSNCMYQSNFMVNSSHNYQRSNSGSNVAGNSLHTFSKHRYSLRNENSFVPCGVTYSTINHNVHNPNNNNQSSLENILKFMKKRSDSNLIDLYCGEEDGVFSNSQSNKCHDDILRLFDPLTNHSSATVVNNTEPEIKKEIIKEDKPNDVIVMNFESQVSKQLKSEDKIHLETIPKEISNVSKIIPTECSSSQISDSVLKIFYRRDNYSKELDLFCAKLKKLRSEFSYDDHVTNAGLVISPTLDSYQEDSLSIKLIITSINCERPVSFTCDVNTSVEHIISHSVCSIFDETTSICMDNFVLKVHGLSEYFTSHSTLADYEYVHQCHKFDRPVCLTLTDIKDLNRPLARNKQDDMNDTDFKCKDIAPSAKKDVISHESLNILLDTLEKEIEKIKSCALKSENCESLKPQGVVQAVKAICTLLSHVETTEITDAVAAFIQVCLLFDKNDEVDFDTLPELGSFNGKKKFERDLLSMFQLLELSLSHLQHAIHELLVIYAKAFRVNFGVESFDNLLNEKMVTDFLDTPLFEVGIVHRVEPNIMTQFENYFLECEIYHGGLLISSVTSKKCAVSKSFFARIVFEEWLQFSNISMCTLPFESVLFLTLWGNRLIQGESKQSNNNLSSDVCIGWCGMRLFSYDGELAQGCFLLGFWSNDVLKNSGPLLSNPNSSCPLLHIRLPDFGCKVKFPPVIDNKFISSQMRSFDTLEPQIQTVLKEIIAKDTLKALTAEEKELLWGKKYCLHQFPYALPKVLLSAHGWDWACLSDIYSLLQAWTPLSPVDSLHLLTPYFPDKQVRKTAIKWMKDIVSDELCDYLPQIVQVLKYEPWDDSPVAWFLLERSLTSVRVAHHLYWLLKENLTDPTTGDRMKLMLNSLLIIAGRAMRNRIKTQESLLENLSSIADKIKTTKESLRLSILFHELEVTHHNLVENPTCLPLSPSLEVCGMDVKSCSYFTSNTLPLRLVFHTPEMTGTNNEAIFKVGDDLRQDMITLQMIRIMDKLWLKEGLDLKIVTFTCIATELRKGMVELVPEAETLRKIQTELGLTGSFKDRPIAEWLQKYNTSELEYQQAVENFTLSCAGYCVATYILGVCDRHNDNIMLKTSGHIFHIDFGKFLGDSQMFGNIKRDRTPFVLTSDMAYVINGGDKPSKKFQYFIDLCGQAFNIIRSHKNIFFTLFTLMTSSGIPGMSTNAVSYIQKALLPDMCEAEATAHFTHMIQDSLKSWFTQFNFFIHNLAQLRFTGDHNEGLLLSFIPKTFSKETDGKIIFADVVGYQKMYDPEKYYIYVVKIERENLPDPMFIFRTYREFVEFHQKLCMMFPLAKFHPLPGNPLMGRTNVREVAERRKMELGFFASTLMGMAEEISHCDLVYTFFHPLLRDQEGVAREKEARSLAVRSRRSSSVTEIHGQVKLSIVYKNNSLFIMVMHAKNLSSPKGTAPDPYVKTYLLPDSNKTTKRKTKIVSKNCHPTFMEMLVYDLPFEVIKHKALHVSIWDYDRVQENEFLGATLIPLSCDLSKEVVKWHPLGQFNN